MFGFTVDQSYTQAPKLVYPLIKLILLIIKPWQTQTILAIARRATYRSREPWY